MCPKKFIIDACSYVKHANDLAHECSYNKQEHPEKKGEAKPLQKAFVIIKFRKKKLEGAFLFYLTL